MALESSYPSLLTWGWNSRLEEEFQQLSGSDLTPGRVLLEFNQFLRLITINGETLVKVSGRRHLLIAARHCQPSAIGSRCVATPTSRTPPSSLSSRAGVDLHEKVKGTRTDQQVIAAEHRDGLFLVTSLNQDYNPRRIELSEHYP
jgi:ribosome biogenesis GTPase